MSEQVEVHTGWRGETHRVGTLYYHSTSRRERMSFEYSSEWLAQSFAFSLDPELPLQAGAFHTQPGHGTFRAFADAAPDRWGRNLMQRANKSGAGSRGRRLSELDFLLMVDDEARQGALRFRRADGPFLAPPTPAGRVPPLVDLPKLLRAATRVLKDTDRDEDLRLLIAPGSSVGGARPKATVRGTDGRLFIAKFSRPDDPYDVNAWEHVALTLAKNVGLNVTKNRLERVAKKPTLIVERFDREKRQRIPFVSAMTLVGGEDMGTHSYLEINEALRRYGTKPKRDLAELWKRMAFNVAISNTDDHLRNHGFLWRGDGWELSPCYDLNPIPAAYGSGAHALLIDDTTGVGDVELVMSLRERFNVGRKAATEFRTELERVVKSWHRVAKRIGIAQRQISQFESAFEFSRTLGHSRGR